MLRRKRLRHVPVPAGPSAHDGTIDDWSDAPDAPRVHGRLDRSLHRRVSAGQRESGRQSLFRRLLIVQLNRAGVNAGYLTFTREETINPF